jgi:hypothetical protein
MSYPSRSVRRLYETEQAARFLRFGLLGSFVFVLVVPFLSAGEKPGATDSKRSPPSKVSTTPDGKITGVVETNLVMSENGRPTYGLFKLRGDDQPRRVFRTYVPKTGVDSLLLKTDMQVSFTVEANPSDGCWVVAAPLKRTRPESPCRPKEGADGRTIGTVETRFHSFDSYGRTHCYFQFVGDERVLCTCASLGVDSQLVEPGMELAIKSRSEPDSDHASSYIVTAFEQVQPSAPGESARVAEVKPANSPVTTGTR